jgi:diguanylate cyclase (GGDEF)-like protein
MAHSEAETADAQVVMPPTIRSSTRTALKVSILILLPLHAIAILALGHSGIAASRLLTAVAPVLGAACVAWRAQQLARRERAAWRWLMLSMLFYSAGQLAELWLGRYGAASNLTVDGSDFFYICAAIPLLLAVSSTRETESIRGVSYLDFAQVSLALVLTWVLLFETAMPAQMLSTEMMWIYAAECFLLALAAALRLASWSTFEERRRIRLMGTVLWLYLPIELGMDFATSRWHLSAGTPLDLLWSVPFLFGGWRALDIAMDEPPQLAEGRTLNAAKLLGESLCPLLFAIGIFALAVSINRQHPALAFSAIFLLLVIQGLHAGLVQLRFLTGQKMLLEREQELQTVNATLEQLSMLDPMTGIPNRRRFTAALEQAWKRAVRTRGPVSVLMIDVDYFKGVNDLHGHTYGDQCLSAIARALAPGRSNDLLARYGGDELMLLLPETDGVGAMKVADRIQHSVDALALRNDASPFDKRLTISIGLAVSSPRLGMNHADLVDVADQALYEAKHRGRNRIFARTLDGAVVAEGILPQR